MPSGESSIEAAGARVPEELAEVGVYATPSEGFDHGLVVLAMGSPYWLLPSNSHFRLLVAPKVMDQAREQLALYDRESARWPPRPPAANPSARETDLITPLLWALAVLAAYWGQGQWPGRLEEIGALDGRVFSRGEGWRLATALFLHADVGHLVSNLLSGVFVFSAVVSTIGRRRGWLLLASSSIAGNLAAAALRASEPYRSLGASTGIFAGLGLLTGRAIRLFPRADASHRLRGAFVPLAAGVTVLTLYGAGGIDVDVLAHLTGFVAGLAFGFVAVTPPRLQPDKAQSPPIAPPAAPT